MPAAAKPLAKPTLADRLTEVVLGETIADYQTMSLQELGKCKIQFGKAKKDMTFDQLMKDDPKYVQWFLRKYENQGVASHQPFLRFVKLFIEDKESKKETTSAASGTQKKETTPIEIDLSSDSDWSEANALQTAGKMKPPLSAALQGEVETQNLRISNIEVTMNSLVNQVQAMTELIRGSVSQGYP